MSSHFLAYVDSSVGLAGLGLGVYVAWLARRGRPQSPSLAPATTTVGSSRSTSWDVLATVGSNPVQITASAAEMTSCSAFLVGSNSRQITASAVAMTSGSAFVS